MTHDGPRPRRRTVTTALTIASGANALLLIALWGLERSIGESNWLVLLLTYAPQVFYGFVSVLLIGTSLALRRWTLAAANVIAALFVVFAVMDLQIHPEQNFDSSRALTVMTYNVDKWGTGAAQIASVVRAQNPDIACFQEAGDYFYVPGHQPDAFKRLIPGYRFVSQGELIVASRLPITHIATVPLPPGPESRPALAVTVLGNRGDITVICVHLLPTQLDGKLLEPTPRLAADCRAFGAARIAQSRELLAFTRTVPQSFIIVCGDFNAPPQSEACRMLADTYPDAFDASGNGFGYTVTSDLPLTRIDHILTGDGVKVWRVWVPNTRASDHRPLIAKIAFAS